MKIKKAVLLVLISILFNLQAAAVVGFAVFFYYYQFSRKQFGGITGDLAGYFLQLCELFMLAVLALF